jgi:branched-chain amino acid transport system permease protein
MQAFFAMSLDLLLGHASIISLGHAVFFGIGAYAAGCTALFGWHEPISGYCSPVLPRGYDHGC